MQGGKLTYDELRRKCNSLELKLKEALYAIKAADRAIIGYSVDRWVSIPLPFVQADAIRETVKSAIARVHGEGKLLGGSRANGDSESWEIILDTDSFLCDGGFPLAEYVAMLVRYECDDETGIHNERMWALVPV